jgi:hypothetical protein
LTRSRSSSERAKRGRVIRCRYHPF